MTRSLKELPDDQLAVLSLLLSGGRSYDEIARLSGADSGAVRARAHTAAAQLVESNRPPDAATRALIVDYLLGVQSHADRVRSCYLLAGSPPDREWATRLSRALAPLTKVPLPVIPGEGPLALN